MSTRTYNQFFPGIKQDDFLTAGPNFIEGNNITGLREGYAATLGPKMNKQLLTDTAPRTIFGRERTDLSVEDFAVGCDGGDIYKLTSTDNTPIYTLTNNYDVLNGALLLKGSNYMYFAARQPLAGSTTAILMQVTLGDFQNETFASVNEGFLNFNVIGTPPMLISGEFLYVGGLNTVYRIDGSGTIVSHSIFNRYVTGITKQGTQFKVYTDSGEVSYWDGVSSSVTAVIPTEFKPARVSSYLGTDHIITLDGDYHMGSGYTFSEPIVRKRESSRLNDNSQYIKKFDFTPEQNTGRSIEVGRGFLFMLSADTKPGIYQSGKLIGGLPRGYHKIITRDNTNVEFDKLFTQTYIGKGQSKLFIGFQSGTTTFGIDYIDLNSKETAKDGYLVSDIFSGGTAFDKEIDLIRFAKSYASGDDYLKLYKRINNGSWEEIILTEAVDDTITRENLTTETGEWIDIQFKIEFHNEAQDEFPPLLNEFSHDYTVTKT